MRRIAILATRSLAATAAAQQDYSEGIAVPHRKTPAEARHTLRPPEAATTYNLPTGPVHCPAEYEPMDAIIVAYEGSTSWKNILVQMAANITTIGDADVYVACDSTFERDNTARPHFNSGGVVQSRMKYVIASTNTIWMRDYGPRYIYEGDCRVIVDHTYNIFSRTSDNSFPSAFSNYLNQERYNCGLVHGGGNFHLDATGKGRATRLINNENPGLTESQIKQRWLDYQNLDVELYNPFPTSVDATQHIDMWMQVIADDAVMISDWPNNPGSTQDNICDSTALSMAAEGYTVHRVPAYNVGGTHYTFTNVVMCNDLVLIPSYTNSTASQSNGVALSTWQAALPSKTIVQIPCQSLVTAAGVMHCIVMHLPEHKGGLNPTMHLRTPNGGEDLVPGSTVEISWISDDNRRVDTVDILFSTDGGVTFPTTIATGLPANSKYAWTVPMQCTTQGRIRVVGTDPGLNTGFDDSDANFSIDAAACAAESSSYGTGKPGINGTPLLTATTPIIGGPLTFDLVNGPAGQTALLGNGPAAISVPFDGGTLLVSNPALTFLTLDSFGELQLTLPLPFIPQLEGLSLYWQAWIPGDPGASGSGWSSSNGVQTRFGL